MAAMSGENPAEGFLDAEVVKEPARSHRRAKMDTLIGVMRGVAGYDETNYGRYGKRDIACLYE